MWLIKQFKKDKSKTKSTPTDTTGTTHTDDGTKKEHDKDTSSPSPPPAKPSSDNAKSDEPSPVPPPARTGPIKRPQGKPLVEACKLIRVPDEVVKNTFYYDYYRGVDVKIKESYGVPLTGLKPSNTYHENRFKLQSFSIDAKINDTCSISVYRQKYTNTFSSPVEAVYELALPSYATVSAFQVEFDNKILKGIIKDKATAKAEYSDAIASGGQAFMAEKTDSGMFNLQLGNIPKEMEVTVEVTIISEIGTYMNDLHYFIHSSMFPPGNYNFRFTAEVYLSQPIVDIGFDRYEVTSFLTDGPHYIKIEYSNDPIHGVPPVTIGNILLSVTPQPSEEPQSFIEYNAHDKTYAIGVNFYPLLKIEPEFLNQKSEFIFVLDCSGSMSGSRISRAKDVLQLIMRSLNENIKFNIVLFGSDFKKVYPESVLYSDSTLTSASDYIHRIDADLGGTELFPPIKDVLKTKSDPEYPRQVFVLTDGEIYDRPQLIAYVSKEASSSRIFTIGIGGQVDRELVIGLSKCCKGFYDFISEYEADYESKVMDLLDIAFQPMISNIEVDWGKFKVAQAPQVIRPIYSKERMMIYGVVSDGKSGDSTTIKITGDGPTGERLTFNVPITLDNENDYSVNLHSMATYMRINDLEMDENKNSKDHKELIIKLSKRFGLVSKHTSYIVTNVSDKIVEESMKLVNINKESKETDTSYLSSSPQTCIAAPIELDQCVSSGDYLPTPTQSMAPPPYPGSTTCAAPPPPPAPMCTAPPVSYGQCIQPSFSSYSSQICKIPYREEPDTSDGKEFKELICQQSANGTFQKVPQVIEFDESKKPSDVTDLIWNTVIAIAYIQLRFKNLRSQWRLSVAKATKYIAQQLKQSKSTLTYEQLLEVAKSSLKNAEKVEITSEDEKEDENGDDVSDDVETK